MFLHECKVCGEKFEIGQALGGHMQKHQVMKHERGRDDVGHVLQQLEVEALPKLMVEALLGLKVDVLKEQKAKSDRSEGVMSKADEDEGASHTANEIHSYYEFLKLADA
ncbi:zinc finger protein ZAT11-like protein [Tanacetum coccineum]|uniref:Zinc finger protein ZAT11-like protein n=1 Tax=Tanacetum coccineum TaxID=301880 RepID=A0ABQ5CN78_9ASTR